LDHDNQEVTFNARNPTGAFNQPATASFQGNAKDELPVNLFDRASD